MLHFCILYLKPKGFHNIAESVLLSAKLLVSGVFRELEYELVLQMPHNSLRLECLPDLIEPKCIESSNKVPVILDFTARVAKTSSASIELSLEDECFEAGPVAAFFQTNSLKRRSKPTEFRVDYWGRYLFQGFLDTDKRLDQSRSGY